MKPYGPSDTWFHILGGFAMLILGGGLALTAMALVLIAFGGAR